MFASSESFLFAAESYLNHFLWERKGLTRGPFSLQLMQPESQTPLGRRRLKRRPPYLHLEEMKATVLLPSALISQGVLHFPAHGDPVMGLSETRALFLGAEAPPHLSLRD